MRKVIVESPYASASAPEHERNLAYAREASRDALSRGEAPLTPHLLYTQFLRDEHIGDRTLGILASAEWLVSADAVVVYTDLGISPGMERGIARAKKLGRMVVYRQLTGWESKP